MARFTLFSFVFFITLTFSWSYKIGVPGSTCDATCSASDKKCNSKLQKFLTSSELVAKAFWEAGYKCKSFGKPQVYGPASTGRSHDDCYGWLETAENAEPNCFENKHSHRMLCVCSAHDLSLSVEIEGLPQNTKLRVANGAVEADVVTGEKNLITSESMEGDIFMLRVLEQPSGYKCVVVDGSGEMPGNDVTIFIHCTQPPTAFPTQIPNAHPTETRAYIKGKIGSGRCPSGYRQIESAYFCRFAGHYLGLPTNDMRGEEGVCRLEHHGKDSRLVMMAQYEVDDKSQLICRKQECVQVDFIDQNPGYYSCRCVSSDHPCLLNKQCALAERNCPVHDGVENFRDGKCQCIGLDATLVEQLKASGEVHEYGSECHHWDMVLNGPFADTCLAEDADICAEQNWCLMDFCYVNGQDADCTDAQESIKFPGNYYSYTQCGQIDCYTCTNPDSGIECPPQCPHIIWDWCTSNLEGVAICQDDSQCDTGLKCGNQDIDDWDTRGIYGAISRDSFGNFKPPEDIPISICYKPMFCREYECPRGYVAKNHDEECIQQVCHTDSCCEPDVLKLTLTSLCIAAVVLLILWFLRKQLFK